MARIFQIGAERGQVGTGIDWTATAAGGSGMTLSTTTVRGSRGSYKHDVGGGGTRYVSVPFVSADNTNTKYVKFDYYLDTDNYGANIPEIFKFLNTAGNASGGGVMFSGTPNTLSLTNYLGTAVVTGPTITTGQWYQIEVAYTYNAGGSTAELKVDSVSYGSATVGQSGGANHAAQILWGSTQTAASGTSTAYYDNIIINDSTGSSQTSWVGGQRLLQAHPVAMGDAVTDTGASPYLWQTAAGAVASGDLTNWNRVDENPWDDDTTRSRANTANHYLDIYAVETRATVG
jgi:hypothetical protein